MPEGFPRVIPGRLPLDGRPRRKIVAEGSQAAVNWVKWEPRMSTNMTQCRSGSR
jgi:hypothetical protein